MKDRPEQYLGKRIYKLRASKQPPSNQFMVVNFVLYMWKHHSHLLKISKKDSFKKYKSLFLSQVSDTGQYVCKATNVAGQVDKNFHLNIHGEKQNRNCNIYLKVCVYIHLRF